MNVFSRAFAWLATLMHAYLYDCLPEEVIIVSSSNGSAIAFKQMWWLSRFSVKLWLPWKVEAADMVYLWYKTRCRTFCYVTDGAEILSYVWRWPACCKGKPARIDKRILVARLVSDRSSREVTELLQAFHGPLYDFHGSEDTAPREAGYWFPMMNPDSNDMLYVITASGKVHKFFKHQLVQL